MPFSYIKMKIKHVKSRTRVIEKFEEIYPETGRKLVRPKISWIKVIVFILAMAVIDTVLFFLLNYGLQKVGIIEVQCKDEWIEFLIILFVLLMTILVNAKRIVIFAIRLYQSQAPYTVRCRCLYIPNCSEYMILAINKYGLPKGINMGIKRFNRCKPPYGGEDYP